MKKIENMRSIWMLFLIVTVVSVYIYGMETAQKIPQVTSIDEILCKKSAQTLDMFLSALTSREREACLKGINERSQPEKENAYGEPLLHRAVRYHRLSLLKVILKHGADINGTNDVGQTALHVACEPCISEKDKITKIALFLMESGINCDHPDNMLHTPLHKVAGTRNRKILEKLIAQKVDLSPRNRLGQTPLHLTVVRGHYEPAIMDALSTVARGILYNPDDGAAVVVQMLIDNGALSDLQDNDAFTPLHYAINSNDMKLARLLVDLGASCTVSDSNGLTPSMLLKNIYEIAYNEIEPYKIKGYLIDLNSIRVPIERVYALISAIEWLDGKTLNERSETVLHLLAEVGADMQVWELLRRGAPADMPDGRGKTALHRAAKKGYAPLVATLLEKTEAIVVDNAGNTALHDALEFKQYTIAKQLIDAFLSMLIVANQDDRTPIDMLRDNVFLLSDEIASEDHYIRDTAVELSLSPQSMEQGAVYLLDILTTYGT